MALRQPGPLAARDSPFNGGLRHAVLLSQILIRDAARSVAGTYSADIVGRQASAATTLSIHINDVVGLGAEEQVGRISAVPNVAAVQDVHTLRDGTIRQSPGKAMHQPVFALVANAPIASKRMNLLLPKPAARRSAVKAVPKTFGGLLSTTFISASHAATALTVARPGVEHGTALFTGVRRGTIVAHREVPPGADPRLFAQRGDSCCPQYNTLEGMR